MAPRIPIKGKSKSISKVTRKGVTKQEKSAAKRAGFVKANGTADVAAYRKHKADIAKGGPLPTGPSPKTDKVVAERQGMTVEELTKQREKILTQSLKKEAKEKNISVAEVKKLRAKRKVKRSKTSKKRAYTANKQKVKKLTDVGVSESLAKQVLDPDFTNLPKEKQNELKEKVKKQKAIFKRKPTIVPTDDKPLQVARDPSLTTKEYPGHKKPVTSEEVTDPVRQKQTKERLSFKDQRRKLVSARKKARKAEAKLQKLINSKTNVKANKKKLKNTQEELQNISEAISNQTPIPERKLRGLNIALDIVLEAPEKGRGLNIALEAPHPLAKKDRKKVEQRIKHQEDIIKDLTGRGISKRLATKVANNQSLTKADITKLKKIGVSYTVGKAGSARAPTPLKKLTKREKKLQKVTKEPTPEKWSDFKGLQSLLDTPVGKVKRSIGKVGQHPQGKLFPGNLTPGQVQELTRGKALTKAQREELEGMLRDPDSGLSVRKKGGTVYRKTGGQVSRGTGAALRGFGKATYSHKLY